MPMPARTVQLLKMPDALYWSLNLWSVQRSAKGQPVTLGNLYDEALSWFLTRMAPKGYEAYLAVPLREAEKRCLWVDSELLAQAGICADRDGVPRNRVLYTALILFMKQFGPTATRADIARLRKLKSAGGRRGRPISRSG